LALYDKVIAIDPQNSAAHYNKASILAGQGKYLDAIGPLERAIASNGDDPDMHYALGNCLIAVGQTEYAITA
jgi:tetratricopeptide (TPR) repeat protein